MHDLLLYITLQNLKVWWQFQIQILYIILKLKWHSIFKNIFSYISVTFASLLSFLLCRPLRWYWSTDRTYYMSHIHTTFTQLYDYDYNFIKILHRFSGPHRTTYNSSNQNNLTFGPPQPPPRKLSISLMDQILKPSISQAPTPDKLEP